MLLISASVSAPVPAVVTPLLAAPMLILRQFARFFSVSEPTANTYLMRTGVIRPRLSLFAFYYALWKMDRGRALSDPPLPCDN
jgi:hypothetical protein